MKTSKTLLRTIQGQHKRWHQELHQEKYQHNTVTQHTEHLTQQHNQTHQNKSKHTIEKQSKIRRATGPGRVRASASVPSPCSLFPSGTGLQSWSPEDTIYGVLGGGPGLRDLPRQTLDTYPWNVQKIIKKLSNFLADFRANIGPTWLPKLTPDGYKIDAKIYYLFRCLLNSFFFRCWWILGGEMEPN